MRRTLGALAALALSITGLFGGVVAPTQAAAAPAAPAAVTVQRYAALGDSFAAGYGLPSKSDQASILCARSNLAYPELLNGLPSLKKLDFVACSGATVYEVLGTQLAALGPSTRTVTLTVGGNDLGFGELTCLQDGSCDLDQLSTTAAKALAALAGGPPVTGPSGDPVISVFSLLAAIHEKAPNARIFLTGYPELFGTSAKVFGTKTACPVSVADRAAVNTLTDKLNAVLSGSAAAARAGGMDVRYVGVTKAFDGHGVCDSKAPFISTVLHPNLLGQATYATVLALDGVAR